MEQLLQGIRGISLLLALIKDVVRSLRAPSRMLQIGGDDETAVTGGARVITSFLLSCGNRLDTVFKIKRSTDKIIVHYCAYITFSYFRESCSRLMWQAQFIRVDRRDHAGLKVCWIYRDAQSTHKQLISVLVLITENISTKHNCGSEIMPLHSPPAAHWNSSFLLFGSDENRIVAATRVCRTKRHARRCQGKPDVSVRLHTHHTYIRSKMWCRNIKDVR